MTVRVNVNTPPRVQPNRLVVYALFRVHLPQTLLFMSPEVCHRLSRRMRVITSGWDRIEFTRLRISFPCRVHRDKPGTGPSCVGCEACPCVCPLAWVAYRTRSTSDRCCCTRFRRPATRQRPSLYPPFTLVINYSTRPTHQCSVLQWKCFSSCFYYICWCYLSSFYNYCTILMFFIYSPYFNCIT